MREVNTNGAAGGGVWLRPSVCVRAIGTRCRRGLNRQGSEVEKLARATPGCVKDADRQTDAQTDRHTDTDTQTDRQTDRQTDGQTDTQTHTDTQTRTDTLTHRQTDTDRSAFTKLEPQFCKLRINRLLLEY